MIGGIVFSFFAACMLAASVLVVSLRNPVHAMLALIVTLFNASGVVLTLGAEYVAFIMVIVYGGAVAVLFLFVVMMLDVDHKTLRRGTFRDLPAIGVVTGLLVGEILLVAENWHLAPQGPAPAAGGMENIRALGNVLFTDYALAFETAGVILLVATVGAILLTHRKTGGIKRQNAFDQIARKPSDVLELCHVQPGESVWDEGED